MARFGRIALLISVVLLAATATRSQENPRSDDVPQYSPWSAPVNLGPAINTAGNDSGACISPDSLSLYFISNARGGYGGTDFFVSHRDSINEPWGTPQNLGPNINSPYNEAACAFSPDGHRLFFHSTRPGFGGQDLYVARRRDKRNDFGWQPAENLGPSVNTAANEAFPVVFEDDAKGRETLYFASDRPGMGGWDIYASLLQADETWGTPVLVEELSTPSADLQPGIRRDGLEIFITSNRPGSFSSLTDIWVATRASTSDPWSTPANLGPIINLPDPYSQGRPSISFDGTEMYFFSVRPGGFGAQDIYVSTRTKLKD